VESLVDVALKALGLVAAVETLCFGARVVLRTSKPGRRTLADGVEAARSVGWMFRPGRKPDHRVEGWAMSDPYLGYRNLPNSRTCGVDEAGRPHQCLRIDPFGFVANDSRPGSDDQITDRTFNIFVTGGSTAVGGGASRNETTYASLLERLLNEGAAGKPPTRPVRVINAGVNGYNSAQELIYILFDLLYCKPDLIVMFNGINEGWFLGRFPARVSTDWHHNFRVLEGSEVPAQVLPATVGAIRKILERRGWTVADPKPGYAAIEVSYRSWGERYVGTVEAAAAAVSSRDVGFMHVLQPTSGWGGRSYTPEETRLGAVYNRSGDEAWNRYLENLHGFYGEVTPRLESLARGHEHDPLVAFANASHIFDNVEASIYCDARHYNDLGQSILADFLRDEIVKKFGARLYGG
jgi:lysophospholipase L1-like esterase